jgi:hypothetical protein
VPLRRLTRFASLLAGAMLCVLVAATAAAQVVPRKIPAEAARGSFTPAPFPEVLINGKRMRLAPGARILLPNNLTATPNQIAADTPVRYELDGQGLVRTVWVLNPQEARKK